MKVAETYPTRDNPLQDRRGAAAPFNMKICAEVTILLGEQKPSPVWFYCLRKSELSGIV